MAEEGSTASLLPHPPEGPPAKSARVTKKNLVCSDGSTVRIRSPNLHRALSQVHNPTRLHPPVPAVPAAD